MLVNISNPNIFILDFINTMSIHTLVGDSMSTQEIPSSPAGIFIL